MTIPESIINYLDIVTHDDRYETITQCEYLLPDDCDVVIHNYTSEVLGNYLVLEAAIEVKLHCTSYTVWST